MAFWRKANNDGEEMRATTQQPLQKIQTEFSDIVHRIGNSLKMPWKVNKNDDYALSDAEIKSRMAGIPAYKLATHRIPDQQIAVFGSDDRPERELKLQFVSKPDALDFLEQLKLDFELDLEPHHHWGIFATPLADFICLDSKESSIRLVPAPSQIKNAFEVQKKNMSEAAADDDFFFSGVPVFKCAELGTNINKKPFRPVYLRKEDLQHTLTGLDISPANIEVASLEEIIQEMKDGSTNKSNDVIFVGPGDTSLWLINSV